MPSPPIITRSFLLLGLGHMLQALGYSSLLLLPLYLDTLGATRTEIGAIMASAAIGGVASRPIVGWALDRFGRHLTLVAGTLLVSGGMGLVALVDTVGPLVYAARVLFGIGGGALFTGYFAFAADVIPTARRTEGIALFGITGLLPLALNPVAGGLGLEPAGVRVYVPLLGLAVLASLLAIAMVPARPVATGASGRVTLRAAWDAIRHRRLLPVWHAAAVFSGLVGVFMAFATVAAEHRGVPSPAALWGTYAAGAVLARLLGGRLPDRFGPRNLVAPALASYGGAFVVAAAAWSTEGFLAAGLLAGIGHGYAFPVLASQTVTRTPDHLRGSALATFTGLWDLSGLVLTPCFGAFSDVFGDASMFALAAVVAALGLAGWAVLEHRLGAEAELRATAPPDT